MKAMVLFSGGVDSTTALALAVEKYGASEVLALSIYYGQKHKDTIVLDISENLFKGGFLNTLSFLFRHSDRLLFEL